MKVINYHMKNAQGVFINIKSVFYWSCSIFWQNLSHFLDCNCFYTRDISLQISALLYTAHTDGPPTQKIGPVIAEKGITAAVLSPNWQKLLKVEYPKCISQIHKVYFSDLANCICELQPGAVIDRNCEKKKRKSKSLWSELPQADEHKILSPQNWEGS